MSIRLVLLRTSVRPLTSGVSICSSTAISLSARQCRPILKSLHQTFRQSVRRASTAPPLKTAPAPPGRKYAYPSEVLIYHAGTGRTTFIACLKLTTIFVFVFFGIVVTPAYIKSDHPLWHAGGIFACGLIPLLTVAYTTAPFVTNIYIRPPTFARQSTQLLRQWASSSSSTSSSSINPTTPISITTMSFIGKPRVSTMTVGDLVPVKKKLGLVNYVRADVERENERRKWYMFRAVGEFNIGPGGDKRVGAGFVWPEVERVVKGLREGGKAGEDGKGKGL